MADSPLPDNMTILTRKKSSLHGEFGQTGLMQYGGYIQEEFLSELQGGRWARLVREMLANDAVVHTLFFVVELLVRAVDWKVKPGSDDNEGNKNAEFIDQCRDDMSQSWKDLISEILSYLPWGWSYHEIVYKQRNGEVPGVQVKDGVAVGPAPMGADGQDIANSKYDDGRIGWRKIPIRSQDSLSRWELDRRGGIQGMWQQTYVDPVAFIPIDTSLLFRTSIHKNNPEGRSLCRRIYRSWYYKNRIENIEGIGIERDLAGLPKGTMPSTYLSETASAGQKQLRALMEKVLMNVRNDDQSALIIPSDVYEGTSIPMFDVALMSTGGTRQFDTNKIIQRYDQRILMIMIADFLLLGHEKVGSFALASSKTELFSVACGGFLDVICDVFNRHAIPRLLRLNGLPTEKQPMLEHGDIETIDLKDLADLISKISDTKIALTDEDQDWIMQQAGVPIVPGARTKLREENEKKALDIARQTGAAAAAKMNKPGEQQNLPLNQPAPNGKPQKGLPAAT